MDLLEWTISAKERRYIMSDSLDYYRTVIDILTKNQFGYNKPQEEIDIEQLIVAYENYIKALAELGGEADEL